MLPPIKPMVCIYLIRQKLVARLFCRKDRLPAI